jgi:hypothetical protein
VWYHGTVLYERLHTVFICDASEARNINKDYLYSVHNPAVSNSCYSHSSSLRYTELLVLGYLKR